MPQVRPKKFLGQHFLTDLQVARNIADTVDACPDIPVLEVGPGMGVLTQFLLQKNREIKVVELDRESVQFLKDNMSQLGDNIITPQSISLNSTSWMRLKSKPRYIHHKMPLPKAKDDTTFKIFLNLVFSKDYQDVSWDCMRIIKRILSF